MNNEDLSVAGLVLCRCFIGMPRRCLLACHIKAFWAVWFVSFGVTPDEVFFTCTANEGFLQVGRKSNS